MDLEQVAAVLRSGPAVGAMATAGMAALAGLGSAAVALVPLIRRRAFGEVTHVGTGDYLGWHEVVDADPVPGSASMRVPAIVTHVKGEQSWTVFFKIEGRDIGGLGEPDLLLLRRMRSDCFSWLGDSRVHARIWVRRERIDRHGQKEGLAAAPPVVRAVIGRHEGHVARDAKRTIHFMSLTASGKDQAERLKKAVRHVTTYLKPFGPRLLDPTLDEVGGNELLGLLGGLVNPAAKGRALGPAVERLGRHVATGEGEIVEKDECARNGWARGCLRWRWGDKTVYGYLVGVSEWGLKTSEALQFDLMTLGGEWDLIHQARPLDGQESDAEHAHVSRSPIRFVNAEAARQFQDIGQLLQHESGVRERYCHYDQVVIAYGATPEEASNLRDQVEQIYIRHGVIPIPETSDLCGMIWWSMFPGFEEAAFVRKTRLLTLNIGTLVNFDAQAQGLSGCGWGPSHVLSFPTLAGSTYRLTFHVNAHQVDARTHAVLFGPNGAGKTVLASMLGYGARAHYPNLSLYVGDRKLGQLIANVAAGARYVGLLSTIDGLPPISLNPFARQPMDQELKSHLLNLLGLMAQVDKEDNDTDIAGRLEDLVAAAERMSLQGSPLADRSLGVLAEATVPGDSRARGLLRPYLPGGTYEHVFGQGAEKVPLDDEPSVVFDFTTVLDDARIAAPVVTDITWLIQRRVKRKGGGALVILDESKALWTDPAFLKRGVNWLEEMRKDRCCVVTMWQRPSQPKELHPNLSSILQTQCALWIFLRDANAKMSDYEGWLTPEELDIVRGTDPRLAQRPRAILIKKPDIAEAVVVDADFSHLGELLNLFRSDEVGTRRVRELMTRHGQDGFVPIWLEEAGRAR